MKRLVSRAVPPRPLLISAVVSGILLTLSFPTISFGFLSLVALVPVFVATAQTAPSRKTSFQAGYWFGIAYFLSLMWWVVRLISERAAVRRCRWSACIGGFTDTNSTASGDSPHLSGTSASATMGSTEVRRWGS